jgi:hypothetical protein
VDNRLRQRETTEKIGSRFAEAMPIKKESFLQTEVLAERLRLFSST